MIKTHSDDPNVSAAAAEALAVINDVLAQLPKAETFDYGGHELKIGEYEVCAMCSRPIAEAQQASKALLAKADELSDPTIKEHLELAAQLLKTDADAAIIRAEFHNGFGAEPILNRLLGFVYEREIHDQYVHNHGQHSLQQQPTEQGQGN